MAWLAGHVGNDNDDVALVDDDHIDNDIVFAGIRQDFRYSRSRAKIDHEMYLHWDVFLWTVRPLTCRLSWGLGHCWPRPPPGGNCTQNLPEMTWFWIARNWLWDTGKDAPFVFATYIYFLTVLGFTAKWCGNVIAIFWHSFSWLFFGNCVWPTIQDEKSALEWNVSGVCYIWCILSDMWDTSPPPLNRQTSAHLWTVVSKQMSVSACPGLRGNELLVSEGNLLSSRIDTGLILR